MNQVIMFEKLREYLTKEYMRLVEDREVLLGQKILLEEEEKKTKDMFFQSKRMEMRKRLFSPLGDRFFENARKEKEEQKENNDKIKKMENNVNKLNSEIKELKEYISFVQSMVQEKKDTFGVTADLKEMLLTVASFLQSQYTEIEFLTDFEEDDMITSVEFNSNLIRILTYTISSTIETIEMDSVIIEAKRENEKINIIIYMLLEDEVLDYYTYDFNFTGKTTTEIDV